MRLASLVLVVSLAGALLCSAAVPLAAGQNPAGQNPSPKAGKTKPKKKRPKSKPAAPAVSTPTPTVPPGTPAPAQNSDDTSLINEVLFPWIEEGDFADNWLEGLGLVGLGIIGALVTVYLFVGGLLPSMGGKAEYEAVLLQIRELEDRRDKQIVLREGYSEGSDQIDGERRAEATHLTNDLTAIIKQKEGEARGLRRHLVGIGFPIYVVLGGAFAVLFATNALQALLIGFGWTAIADRIGLKRELQEKQEIRGEAIGNLAQVAKTSEQKAQEAQASEREALNALNSLRAKLADALSNPTAGEQDPPSGKQGE